MTQVAADAVEQLHDVFDDDGHVVGLGTVALAHRDGRVEHPHRQGLQPAATVGDAANFLLENQQVQIALNNGNPLYIELPASVVLEITYTEPGLQGDRSSAGTKPATVETGYEIQVPLFLETGTKVKVDTRTGDYLGRVN